MKRMMIEPPGHVPARKGRSPVRHKGATEFRTFLTLMLPALAAVWILCTVVFGYAPLL